MVLFRCDWFNQEGKTRGPRDDSYFKFINVQSLWYKTDPFILSTQLKKICYLEDTALGKDWQVVRNLKIEIFMTWLKKMRPVMMCIRMIMVLILSI